MGFVGRFAAEWGVWARLARTSLSASPPASVLGPRLRQVRGRDSPELDGGGDADGEGLQAGAGDSDEPVEPAPLRPAPESPASESFSGRFRVRFSVMVRRGVLCVTLRLRRASLLLLVLLPLYYRHYYHGWGWEGTKRTDANSDNREKGGESWREAKDEWMDGEERVFFFCARCLRRRRRRHKSDPLLARIHCCSREADGGGEEGSVDETDAEGVAGAADSEKKEEGGARASERARE